jgi:hypothetical protein
MTCWVCFAYLWGGPSNLFGNIRLVTSALFDLDFAVGASIPSVATHCAFGSQGFSAGVGRDRLR